MPQGPGTNIKLRKKTALEKADLARGELQGESSKKTGQGKKMCHIEKNYFISVEGDLVNSGRRRNGGRSKT